MSRSDLFSRFAFVAQSIADSRGKNDKIELTKSYLLSLLDLDSQKIAIRFLGEGAFPSNSEKKLSIGHQTIAKAAADFLEMDYDYVFKTCKAATGSSSETIEKLMDAWPLGVKKRNPEPITLREIESFFDELLLIKAREEKVNKLHEMWAKLSALEIKYLIRIMHQYSLRIGFEERSLLKSISLTFGKPLDEVRYAHMLTRSLEKTLEQCAKDRLETIQFSYFKPLAFMLASPFHTVQTLSLSEYTCEEKFDGMRCQAHIKNGEIRLFSRDMNDISDSFPELNSFFLNRKLNEVILDGEICVFKNDTILPFQLLQKRMGVKKPSKALLAEYPVSFIGYDVLAIGKELVLSQPFIERRLLLENLSKKNQLPISTIYEVATESDISHRFKMAKAHGNEGLMLKKKNSIYEFGQRGNAWIKVKEPGGSIDTVLLYAHAGSGKRGGYYSDFTLGVKSGLRDDGLPYFVPIGKAYGGYTDEELKRLNKEIKDLIADRFGPTLGLIPKIVIELEFEEVQQNKRTKAGYTLRLPRFKAIRWDLSIHDVDTIEDVKSLYEAQLTRERLGNSTEPYLKGMIIE